MKHLFFFKSFVLSVFVTTTLMTTVFGMEDNGQPPAEQQDQNRLVELRANLKTRFAAFQAAAREHQQDPQAQQPTTTTTDSSNSDEDFCPICRCPFVDPITTCTEIPKGTDSFGRKLLRFFTLGYCGKRRVTLIEHPHRFCRTCLSELFKRFMNNTFSFVDDKHPFTCLLCRKNINNVLPQLTNVPIIKNALIDALTLTLRLALLCINPFALKVWFKDYANLKFLCSLFQDDPTPAAVHILHLCNSEIRAFIIGTLGIMFCLGVMDYTTIFGIPKTDDCSLFSLMKSMKIYWGCLKTALKRWWAHRHQTNPDREAE